MARFIVVAIMASGPVRYLYEDPHKALKKLRSLQRRAIEVQVLDGRTDTPMGIEAVEALAQP